MQPASLVPNSSLQRKKVYDMAAGPQSNKKFPPSQIAADALLSKTCVPRRRANQQSAARSLAAVDRPSLRVFVPPSIRHRFEVEANKCTPNPIAAVTLHCFTKAPYWRLSQQPQSLSKVNRWSLSWFFLFGFFHSVNLQRKFVPIMRYQSGKSRLEGTPITQSLILSLSLSREVNHLTTSPTSS